MRQEPQRSRRKAQHMDASAVANDARFMLEQLSLPYDARDSIKARRERAIRRANISPSKGMRLWYRQACSLLAHEYLALAEAYKNHIKTLERTHRDLADELQRLREANDIRERHENFLADAALGRDQANHLNAREDTEGARA